MAQGQALGRHVNMYVFLLHVAGVLAINYLAPFAVIGQDGHRASGGNGGQNLAFGIRLCAQIDPGSGGAHGNDDLAVSKTGHAQGIRTGISAFCGCGNVNDILANSQANVSIAGNGGSSGIGQGTDGYGVHIIAHDGGIGQGVGVVLGIQHRARNTQTLQLVVGIAVGGGLGAGGFRHVVIHGDHEGKGPVQQTHIIIRVVYRQGFTICSTQVLHVLMAVHAAGGGHVKLFQIQGILSLGDVLVSNQLRTAQQGLVRGVPAFFLCAFQTIFDDGGLGAAAGADVKVVIISLIACVSTADQRRLAAGALLLAHTGSQMIGGHVQLSRNGHKGLGIGHRTFFIGRGKAGKQGVIFHKRTL